MSDITLFDRYGTELALAIVMLTCLHNVVLICRINFRRERLITKLTLRPYYVSLAYLIALIPYCINASLEFEINLSFRFQTELSDFSNCMGKILLLCFIAVRIFEDSIILLFMDFQNAFRLEELEIARSHFRRKEQVLSYNLRLGLYAIVGSLTISFLL